MLLRTFPLVSTRFSVPDSAVHSVSLTQLLWSDARDCVRRWSELMFNSMLRSSHPRSVRILRTLFRKRLVRFSRTPRFHCTFFSVHQKQGRQRLIVDARETNRHFKRPPSVALASPEALAGLECSADNRFWISTVNVRIAWPSLMTYLTASLCLGAQRVRCVAVLPVPTRGFSWAVYVAQQATTVAVVEATGIAESELVHDRQVNVCLEHGPKDREKVHRGRISPELCSRGLLTHELCLASRCCRTGW